MVLAPEHPLVDALTDRRAAPTRSRPTSARPRHARTTSTARTRTATKTGVFTGSYATNPVTGEHDPGVDRRLRADGLRHRGDHGRAVRRPARLRVRPPVRPADPGDPAAARRVVRRRDGIDADARHDDVARGVRRRRAVRQLAPTTGLDLERHDAPSPRASERIIEWLERQRRRRGDRHLQAARLAVQPPALLGRAVPDRLRRRRPPARPARRRSCRWCCPRPTASRRARSTPTTSSPNPESPLDRLDWWVDVELDLGDGPQPLPPRHQRDAAVGRQLLVRAALPATRPTRTRFVDPGRRGVLDGPAERAGPPGRRRPVRRRRRARRAAPAVRPLLAQGAVRPGPRVSSQEPYAPAVQPGLHPGRRVQRRPRASTSRPATSSPSRTARSAIRN